ncbi:MAG: hypothetical protein EOM25_01405 [Deltaproteobacteria bacterium]|nr:hypothetical protein [Deltaproteobacteria bacterium]
MDRDLEGAVDLACTSCEARFRIPDEKLPESKRFGVRCPRCGSKIVVDRDKGPELKAEEVVRQVVRAGATADVLEFFPPGARVAFSALPEGRFSKTLYKALQLRGIHISLATYKDTDHARLMLNTYQIVVLHDDEHGRSLLDVIHSWTGTRRREVNVVMAGGKAVSMDPVEAFRLGVNMYLNEEDVEKMDDHLDNVEKAFEVHVEMWNKARRNLDRQGGQN